MPASGLLASLAPADLDRIERDLDRIRLEAGRLLVQAHSAIRRVYFRESGLITVSITMADGRLAGVTMIGNEGLVGATAIVGGSGATEATVQVSGRARGMAADRFRAAVRESAGFREVVERYVASLMEHLAQSVGCNRLHTLDQRAARWLLLAHDRGGSDSFPLTQEAFSDLLGVSRPAVSTVGARFSRMGAAEFRRGTVRVLDLARLEAASCDCLQADREAFRWAVRLGRSTGTERHSEAGGGNRPLGILRPQIRRAR